MHRGLIGDISRVEIGGKTSAKDSRWIPQVQTVPTVFQIRILKPSAESHVQRMPAKLAKAIPLFSRRSAKMAPDQTGVTGKSSDIPRSLRFLHKLSRKRFRCGYSETTSRPGGSMLSSRSDCSRNSFAAPLKFRNSGSSVSGVLPVFRK